MSETKSKKNNNQQTQTQNSESQASTQSYKHVQVERERPSLTKTNGSNQQASNKNQPGNGSTKSHEKRKAVSSNSTLKVIPLGGLDAIGKNMTVLECNGDMIVDDAGLMFPDDNHPGIDLILPDYTYVLENAQKLRGIVITHGHEDHTGCLPYLLKDLDQKVCIYATKLTLGLIEIRLNEFHIKNVEYCEIKPGMSMKLGCFTMEFFAVNHSIPGAVGIFFQTPAGNVLHMGDFKLDQTPIDGIKTDFGAIARFSERGIDLMLSDSTNATKREFTPSESVVGTALNSIIAHAKGKVVIASFASHIHRMQQICDAAVANGRKVVVTGRSMIQNTDVARKLGYLNVSDNDIIDAYELNDYPANKIVVMCTGSQGEPLSALARIASGEHRTISLEEGDTVIVSATPVPGNEKSVTRVINQLVKMGVDVYDKSRAMVHVSGHAGAEELKIVLSLANPRAFMPVHGEALHLRAHAELAQQVGVNPNKIFICENGESLKIYNGETTLGPRIPSGIIYVDGLSVGDTSQGVLDERVSLSSQGCACICFAVSEKSNRLASPVEVELRGVSGEQEERLVVEAQRAVEKGVLKALEKGLRGPELKKAAKDALLSLIWERTKQRPFVIVCIPLV